MKPQCFTTKGGLFKILFIAACGMLVYLGTLVAYRVNWRCLSNEMECVVYEVNTEIMPERLASRTNSSCSERSTKRGPNQKVISYSFYGSDKSPRKYFEGITTNAVLVAKYYPGWVMRVYCNMSMSTFMVNMQENFSFVDFCLVDNIEDHGNLGEKFGMLWRFIPMGDRLVDVFMSRDLDSVITPRELAAVNEWLDSNKTFHIMRDHPQHKTEILGGMWGARVDGNRKLLQELLAKMLNHGDRKHFVSGLDQELLRKFVWKITDGDCVLHDSYFCDVSYLRHKVWRPWPTERENFHFVGAAEPDEVLKDACPESCRKHKNWTYC